MHKRLKSEPPFNYGSGPQVIREFATFPQPSCWSMGLRCFYSSEWLAMITIVERNRHLIAACEALAQLSMSEYAWCTPALGGLFCADALDDIQDLLVGNAIFLEGGPGDWVRPVKVMLWPVDNSSPPPSEGLDRWSDQAEEPDEDHTGDW